MRERSLTDQSALTELWHFCPKFLGSENMFATIDEDTEFFPVATVEWNEAIPLARETYKQLESAIRDAKQAANPQMP
jgi:hypothetical protein